MNRSEGIPKRQVPNTEYRISQTKIINTPNTPQMQNAISLLVLVYSTLANLASPNIGALLALIRQIIYIINPIPINVIMIFHIC